MFNLNDFLTVLNAGYVLAFIVVTALVLWLVRPTGWKWSALAVVCAAFAYPLITSHLENKERQERNRIIGERFQTLCKEKAGDRIVRTVEGVEGFFLMRPRKLTKDHKEYLDQFWMGDPYGHSDLEAKHPGEAFLGDRSGDTADSKVKITPIVGFEFIELPNPDRETKGDAPKYLRIVAVRRTTDKDGRRSIEFENTLTDTLRSRYGVNWEDISTPEDRKIWIAGGRMRVVDLKTQEVIAERTGYVIDPEQGQRFGGGISWLIAQRTACPSFENEFDRTKEFVSKVLKSSRSK
jgi:hypothetical protein